MGRPQITLWNTHTRTQPGQQIANLLVATWEVSHVIVFLNIKGRQAITGANVDPVTTAVYVRHYAQTKKVHKERVRMLHMYNIYVCYMCR